MVKTASPNVSPDAAVRLAAERPAVLQHQHRRRAARSLGTGLPVEHGRHARAGTSRPPGPAARIPAYGVLRLRLASAAGSTVHGAAGSTRVRFAGAPGAGSWPCSARPAMRAGVRDIRSAMPSQPSSSSSVVTTMDSAVSSPSMPGRAYPHSHSLSCTACGAWSVATTSMTPSTSAGPQRGHVGVGAQRRVHLEHRVVALGARSSVSSRWCGVTSAVTRMPRRLAQRRISTLPAVETWQTCSRAPTCSASSTSRAMIASSATAGQPGRPSRAETIALVHLRALGQPGLLGVLGDHPVERLHVLQRPPHQPRIGDAVAVVGEDPHPRRRVGHRAELGQALAGQPDRDRADRLHVDQAGLAAQPPDLLDHAGGVGHRRGVRHRADRGVAAQRRRPRAGLDRLGVLPARLAQVGVQVDQAGQRDQSVGVDDLGALGGGADRADRGDHAVAQQQVGRRRRRAPARP